MVFYQGRYYGHVTRIVKASNWEGDYIYDNDPNGHGGAWLGWDDPYLVVVCPD